MNLTVFSLAVLRLARDGKLSRRNGRWIEAGRRQLGERYATAAADLLYHDRLSIEPESGRAHLTLNGAQDLQLTEATV